MYGFSRLGRDIFFKKCLKHILIKSLHFLGWYNLSFDLFSLDLLYVYILLRQVSSTFCLCNCKGDLFLFFLKIIYYLLFLSARQKILWAVTEMLIKGGLKTLQDAFGTTELICTISMKIFLQLRKCFSAIKNGISTGLGMYFPMEACQAATQTSFGSKYSTPVGFLHFKHYKYSLRSEQWSMLFIICQSNPKVLINGSFSDEWVKIKRYSYVNQLQKSSCL